MKYRAVIFDLSGTLVDNWRTAEYEEILSNMAGILCAPTDDFVQLWRESFQERIVGRIATVEENVSQVFKKLKVSIQGHQVSAAAKLLLDFQRHALTPRPDAVRTLDGLSDELTGAANVGMYPVRIHVSYEDPFRDQHAEEWAGPTVSTLEEVLKLV